MEETLAVTHHSSLFYLYISAVIRRVKTLCAVEVTLQAHDWQPIASIFQDLTDMLMLQIQHLCCYKLKQLCAKGVKLMQKN